MCSYTSVGYSVPYLLHLPLPPELGGSWQVTRVVKPDELKRPDERLIEQMKKLEVSPQVKDATQTVSTELT